MNLIKKTIIDICKKNQFLRSLLRKVRSIRHKIYFNKCYRKNKVDDKLIIFESFMGRKYSCSPRAIYEEMLKQDRFKDFKFVWAFKKVNSKMDIKELERAELIKYNSRKYLEYCSKAKYIVTNSRIPEIIKLKEEQVYIQNWHGTPLKKLGYDLTVEGGNALNSLKDLRQKYKEDAERYTYMVSPSKFVTEKYKSCFNLAENNPNVKIIEEGYPRNDFLFNFTDNDVEKIKDSLGIKGNKKIILYAPTWRDNQHQSGVGYTYDIGIDFEKLREKLEEEYIILFRPHYFIANQFDFEKYKGFVYDVSDYEEINDLYIVADILMTDYSSVFFDYANLKRPIIFYMYDLKEYAENIRGFYIGLDELPGKIIENEEELIEEIINVTKQFKYDEKYKAFNEKFNYLDDGEATKRVLDEIMTKELLKCKK